MGCCNCKDPISLGIFLLNNEKLKKDSNEVLKINLQKSLNLNLSNQSNNLRISRQDKLKQRIYTYNTARFHENNPNEEIHQMSKNISTTKIFERILSNIFSKNFSFDLNINKLLNLKRINSQKNLSLNGKNLCDDDITPDIYNEKNNPEILSASKVNEYQIIKFANTSNCRNIFDQKNKNNPVKTKTNEHNKTQDTKDFCKRTRHSENTSTLNKTEQNTNSGQVDKINSLFTNSKFSEIRLNRTRTNDTLLDKIKGKVNAKNALSNIILEPEESKKIEEKIEFQNTMTITEDDKELSLINYEENRNIDNAVKSEEEELHVSHEIDIDRSNEYSKLNSDLRISLDIFKFNSIDDLKAKSNNFKLNSSNENLEQKNVDTKKLTHSIDDLFNSLKDKDLKNQKEEETESAKNQINEKNLLPNSLQKKNKISLLENFSVSKMKNKSINYNFALDRSLKLTSSNKKRKQNKKFDVAPTVLNLNSKLNFSNQSLIDNFNNNKGSVVMLTHESQLSTTENYGNKISHFNTKANNSSEHLNKNSSKIEKKTNTANNNNKSKNNSLKAHNYNNNLNQSNKKSVQMIDLSDKKDHLNCKKSSEIFMNNSKLSNEKETSLNNYRNSHIVKNSNVSIGNNEENYNSIINENYLPDNTESEYLTYNKTVSSEVDFKALTNRQSTVNNKKLNDSLRHEQVKKSKSKNRINVIRLPKKPFNKNKNLNIAINPIYEFQNKNNFGAAANRKNENLISTPINISNKPTENPEKNTKEEPINETITSNININHNNNTNPLTSTNAGKKSNLAIYDFSNEESLFSKKNKSHTPNSRAADSNSNVNNDNEIQLNIGYSDKNTTGFNYKKYNYVFGDGNTTSNTNKTSFHKSQTNLVKKTDQNTNGSNTPNNTNSYTIKYHDNKISQKSILSYQQTAASKDISNLIQKVEFEGDFTNLRGRIKKN